MIKWTGKRIVKLSLYREVTNLNIGSIGYEHFIFIISYVIALYACWQSIGDQHYEALARAEERQINIYDESEKLRKSALDYISGSAGDIESASEPQFQIPSKWLPGFWQSIAFGIIIILHALMVLTQKWSVKFRCAVRFRECSTVVDATHVHVTPNKHQGKEELVPIIRSGPMNSICSFEFHRRKYIYDGRSNSFVKVRCRVDYAISHYREWNGISTELLQSQLTELHGLNAFQISSPQFMDLYIAQITSPFTVFQLFCVMLWCLDEYWRYSLFTLFMICSFEATTVFTRLKSLNTLRGMGNESRKIQLFRMGQWREGSTTDLLPGDIFSLTKAGDDVIPCDAMIVSGSVVVNEATLTGESVPQMKDGISANCDENEVVSIKGQHKVHALFGGTRVLQVTSVEEKAAELLEQQRDEADLLSHSQEESKAAQTAGEEEPVSSKSSIPPPPDGGCLCYCTRTGFSSSQGKLVRMIEHSTAAVGGDTRDTALLLLILLVFALSASGYVLYKGMQDGTRSRYQLLLHCILIVTSVIPPELPMQTALAVNASLMTLMKMQVFCTEPFRVPVAGKVDTCVFDKTGTLTTDELVAVGVVSQGTTIGHLHACFKDAMKALEEAKNAPPPTPVPNPAARAPAAGASPVPPAPVRATPSVAASGLTKMSQALAETTLVLGACHSLVLVDGKVAGDPLEVASLKAVKWELPAVAKDSARPRPATSVKRPLKISTADSGDINVTQVHIVSRHHFSSKLQRMSVVVRMAGDISGGGWVLVKGSPEVLMEMCVDVPADYKDISTELAKRGMRVIALGMRRLKSAQEVKVASEHRNLAEDKLKFVGFASFTCRVRKDSGDIIKQLRDGGNTVAMATGDAMLTAIHVAREVGITTESKRGILILEEKGDKLWWVNYDSNLQVEAFDPLRFILLSEDYDLCVSGGTLNLALEKFPTIVAHLEKFVVFGRMRPDEKERVLLAMKDHGRTCLMCGDGANDVGALKQAHVGVALLSGFGDMNVDRGEKKEDKKAVPAIQNKDSGVVTAANATVAEAEVLTNDQLQNLKLPELKTKLRLLGVEPDDHSFASDRVALIDLYVKTAEKQALENSDVKRHAKLMSLTPQERTKFLAEERKALMQKKQEDFQREYAAMTQRGESWAMFKAMKKIWSDEMSAAKSKAQKDNTFAGSAGKMATMMDALNESQAGMEDLELPMVKIGDASVASPFTSKMPSIRGCLDIVRQGRCTLVTTIQMYQILALNCLINAYSLSVLHLDGVKYGDRQMTCLGILMSVSFVTISRAKPLDKLSKVRPLSSVFHPSLFLSIAGQFLLHLFTMHYLVHEGKKYLPEGHKVELEKEFKPSVVNSIVFLVTAVQQVSVFVVNLKGKPFMGGLTENTPLMWSLAITFIGTFLCASESIPQLNSGLQLEPFPSVAFRNLVLGCLIVDVGGALLWDRLMLGLFSFPILKASLSSTTKQDVVSIVRVVAIVTSIMYWLASQDYTEIMAELEKQEALAAQANQPSESGQLLWKSEDL